MFEAISAQDTESVKYFLEDLNIRSKRKGETVLTHAVVHGNLEIIKLLLSNGADLNALCCHGDTPLIKCITKGNLKHAKYLVENGANTCQADRNGYTPLAHAVYNENTEMIELLLKSHARFTLHSGLFEAIDNCNFKMTKFMLEKGADVNLCGENGEFPLTHAVKKKQSEIVKLLIKKGANINCTDRDGYTPVMRAVQQQNFDMVKDLIGFGADVNIWNIFNNRTALSLALIKNDFRTVELLLDSGADTSFCENLIAKVSAKYPDFGKYLSSRKVKRIKTEP
ncbi:Ankyrin repeat and KH domain-containing protein mask-like Protein [Tribolium castaneum]|uniref:Ankyrin repeat and KH domain-containing protein mask-like Protein n=1 Tax=Tribolium castaneum TaxID=7070 RepID=D6WPE9_TRICA|nr:Ankyrin repeat and KH domain-containing protein mask-like Protein [Tribolium castaneum]